jgi:hypothetical protein
MENSNQNLEMHSTKPPPKPEVSKKKIVLVIIIGIILILSFTTWFFVFRVLTLEQVAAQYFNPGDEVRVGGTITDIERFNTTYGPLTLITLDHYENVSQLYKIAVDNDMEYRIGEWFQTIFHFKEYDFNGNKIITAKELYLSYMLSVPLSIVMDSVSFLAGFRLNYISTDTSGISEYEVFTAHGDEYPLDQFNVSIKKGVKHSDESATHQTFPVIFGLEYLYLSGDYGDSETIDFMESLEDLVSQNETIEFIDANSNNVLDDGDRFKFNIPPTENEFSIETYFISIGGGMPGSRGYAYGHKYLVNWHKGPYEYSDIREIGLNHISNEINGTLANTTIEISWMHDSVVRPYDNFNYAIEFEDFEGKLTGQIQERIVAIGTEHIVDNVYVEYVDANGNTLLDIDDLFVISGVENQTKVTFKIIERFEDNGYGVINFIAGYSNIIGRLPTITLENAGPVQGNPDLYRVSVTTSHWHPQLIVNSTLRLLITNNSSEVEPFDIPLQIGMTQSFNGTNVTFFDADGDTYLSTGDYFEIECQPDTRYYFKLFIFKKFLRPISFNT